MGLKDWLAKNVAGASGYGSAMGRELVTAGLALGRSLYLGHGICATPSDTFIFEDSDHLKSAGFVPYCSDALRRPPMEDSSDLSKHTRVAGVAFAVQCGLTAAENFMKQENAKAFNRSMGSATKEQLSELNSAGLTADMVLQYLRLPTPPEVKRVLNLEKPGSNDVLSVFLQEAAQHSQDGPVGFQRGGILGFDVIAVPLAEETVKAISATAAKFGW